jgi:ribonuclease HII
VAAAVILEEYVTIEGAADSKSLQEGKRNELFDKIKSQCIDYSLGIAEHHEIDSLNILQATMLAMKRAIESLKVTPELILIDGNYFKLPDRTESSYNFKTVVKGDSKIHQISCASIIAKVTRDRLMKQYHDQYPIYDFKSNKGYPTQFHLSVIRSSGICDIHRKTFCRKFLDQYQMFDGQVHL